MEMWTGKPANYSRLYIFRSPVYVMYNTQEVSSWIQNPKNVYSWDMLME
jgi:hypothetical protein